MASRDSRKRRRARGAGRGPASAFTAGTRADGDAPAGDAPVSDPAPPNGGAPAPARDDQAPTAPAPDVAPPNSGAPAPDASTSLQRGYARGRAKDDAARAALVPLEPGERPLAVTVGAIAAALLSLSNLIALGFGYNTDEGNLLVGTLFAAGVLALVSWGMWHARYWAVLGMQTLLAITIVFAGLALLTAYNWWAAVLMVIIIALAGTLFWFLIKAMARIQMPERPSASR